jgi:hypothetical protein
MLKFYIDGSGSQGVGIAIRDTNHRLVTYVDEHYEIPLLCALFPQRHEHLVNPLPVSLAQASY